MSDTPLQLTNLTKRFGSFTAVDDLTLLVPKGSIVGFLGPNGAGKSTSLRMALGVMPPDQGEIELFGEKPNVTVLNRVGFLPEERGLYKKMNPRSIIAYFARLKGMSKSKAYRRADQLLETAGLAGFGKERISKLSKGMAQKVQILSSLAHRPDFLILDEPFSGLDPVNQQGLEELIREEHQRGVTIMFSTHVMEHAERLCDSIIMMARGRKVFDGTLQDAYDALGRAAKVTVDGTFDLGAALQSTPFEARRDGEEGEWRVELPNGQDAGDLLRTTISAGVPIKAFAPEEARLRDVFVSLVSEAEAADLDASYKGAGAFQSGAQTGEAA